VWWGAPLVQQLGDFGGFQSCTIPDTIRETWHAHPLDFCWSPRQKVEAAYRRGDLFAKRRALADAQTSLRWWGRSRRLSGRAAVGVVQVYHQGPGAHVAGIDGKQSPNLA